jgi:hypothetical protein
MEADITFLRGCCPQELTLSQFSHLRSMASAWLSETSHRTLHPPFGMANSTLSGSQNVTRLSDVVSLLNSLP